MSVLQLARRIRWVWFLWLAFLLLVISVSCVYTGLVGPVASIMIVGAGIAYGVVTSLLGVHWKILKEPSERERATVATRGER
jgi:amino acid permease